MNKLDNRADSKSAYKQLSVRMKRRNRILLLILLFLLSFILLYCGIMKYPVDNTTDTKSTAFEDREEKLVFLARYLNIPSEVIDAAYHIVYKDNLKGRVPGPSDYDIRAAFMVEKDEISLWTEGMKKILPKQVDPDWWEDLKSPEFTWEIPGNAEYYIRPDSQSYIVVCPDINIILKMVSTLSIPLPIEECEIPEEISGYDQFKTMAADELGYDYSIVPYIKTILTDQINTSDGTELTLICYRALFWDSPLYGIPILVITGGGDTFCTVLCDGSYDDEWYLADIDGDGLKELLMQHLTDNMGGAGSYNTDVYRISLDGAAKIFCHPDQKYGDYFDTMFTLQLSEGYTHTIKNISTGFCTSFIREASANSPYFDAAGNLTDAVGENKKTNWLGKDPSFYMFKPVDADGDGIHEIMTAQYTYLYGRADSLGAAFTLLKWSNETESMYIAKAGFFPDEDYENDEDAQEFMERFEEYKSSWYLLEEPGSDGSKVSGVHEVY